MVNARLAQSIDALTPRLRLSFNAGEIAELQADVDEAELALAGARGQEHGAMIDRRLGALAAAQAELDDALAYVVSGGNPGTAVVRAGEVLRLDDSYVYVRSVAPDWIDVERGALGSIPAPHAAGVELRPVSPITEVTVTASGGGAVTVTATGTSAEAHEGAVSLTGGGVVMNAIATGRLESMVAMGGGAATLVEATARSASVTATGGGVVRLRSAGTRRGYSQVIVLVGPPA